MGSQHSFTVVDAPSAPVAIVLGAKVSNGKPGEYLRPRLDAAVELYRRGKVQTIDVSGNGQSATGDEPTVMRSYLLAQGIPDSQIIVDRDGSTTSKSCVNAKKLAIHRALIVTQDFHVARAVALCELEGVRTTGVIAHCYCATWTLVRNAGREAFLSRPKALLLLIGHHW